MIVARIAVDRGQDNTCCLKVAQDADGTWCRGPKAILR